MMGTKAKSYTEQFKNHAFKSWANSPSGAHILGTKRSVAKIVAERTGAQKVIEALQRGYKTYVRAPARNLEAFAKRNWRKGVKALKRSNTLKRVMSSPLTKKALSSLDDLARSPAVAKYVTPAVRLGARAPLVLFNKVCPFFSSCFYTSFTPTYLLDPCRH